MDDQMKMAAYAQMYGTWAFQDFLEWLEDAVEAAANRAASLKPEQREHFQAYFMAWQERKKLVAEIKVYIEVCKERGIQDAPQENSGPYPASVSTHLPGY